MLDIMVAGIPGVVPASSFMNANFYLFIPKYLNFVTLSQDLLPIPMLLFCLAFCS